MDLKAILFFLVSSIPKLQYDTLLKSQNSMCIKLTFLFFRGFLSVAQTVLAQCRPGLLGRDLPASASIVLRLKVQVIFCFWCRWWKNSYCHACMLCSIPAATFPLPLLPGSLLASTVQMLWLKARTTTARLYFSYHVIGNHTWLHNIEEAKHTAILVR